jgi:nucleotide-binding universal stress UspA family protein
VVTIDNSVVTTAFPGGDRCGVRAASPRFGPMPRNGVRARIEATNEEAPMDDAPILICYDGSHESRRAIDTAAALLGTGRHAIVLDVGEPLTAAESFATVASAVPGSAFEDLNMQGALERARSGTEWALRAGFEAEPRATLASPTWQAIVDVADELGAAVIVLGSRGLNGARERFEGSVSHDVASHAHRPVLIVPPGA